MSSIFATLLSYLLIYKYLTLFVAVFLAGFIVPVPANNLLLAVGTFASQGYFSFTLSLIVATVANVLGDLSGFFLARWVGPPIIKRFKLDQSKYFVKFEHGLTRYASITVFLTRFYTTIGTLVNLLAGITVSFWTFVSFDILGNFLSTLLFLSLGWLIGGQWDYISDFLGTAGLLVLALIALVILIWFLVKKRWRAAGHNAHNAQTPPEEKQPHGTNSDSQ